MAPAGLLDMVGLHFVSVLLYSPSSYSMVLLDNHVLEPLVFPYPGTQLRPSNPAAPALNQLLFACRTVPARTGLPLFLMLLPK